MPLAECKVCNRRFHGRFAVRTMHRHQTMRHKKQNGVEPEPERLWTKEDLVRAINERVSNNVVSDEKVRVSTDFVWRALSTQQRCELLGDWFIRQATMMKHRQEEKLDAVIDGEIVNA